MKKETKYDKNDNYEDNKSFWEKYRYDETLSEKSNRMCDECPQCGRYDKCPRCGQRKLYSNEDKQQVLVALGFVAVGFGLHLVFETGTLITGALIVIVGAISLRHGLRLPHKFCQGCNYKEK